MQPDPAVAAHQPPILTGEQVAAARSLSRLVFALGLWFLLAGVGITAAYASRREWVSAGLTLWLTVVGAFSLRAADAVRRLTVAAPASPDRMTAALRRLSAVFGAQCLWVVAALIIAAIWKARQGAGRP